VVNFHISGTKFPGQKLAKLAKFIWLFTNECIVFCIVFVSHTRLDLSAMSLTNDIVIIRLAANTINNDEMQQA